MRIALALFACVLFGCVAPGPSAELDARASLDAGTALDAPDASGDRDLDAPTCTGASSAGCACSTPGETTCRGFGVGIQCCGGVWHEFLDDPCRGGRDAGIPACGATPEVGCPCTDDGAIHCRVSYRWRLRCALGTWQEDIGRVCC